MKFKTLIAFVILGLFIISTGSVLAHEEEAGDLHDHMDGSHMTNWMGTVWLLLVILPGIAIISLIIHLILRDDKSVRYQDRSGADTVLDNRYARGEISREEYQRMKKDLKGGT